MVVPEFYVACSTLPTSFLLLLLCILKSWFQVPFQQPMVLEARWFGLGSGDAGKGRTSVLRSEIVTEVLSHLALTHCIRYETWVQLRDGFAIQWLASFLCIFIIFPGLPCFLLLHSLPWVYRQWVFQSQGTINLNVQIKAQTLIMAWRHK